MIPGVVRNRKRGEKDLAGGPRRCKMKLRMMNVSPLEIPLARTVRTREVSRKFSLVIFNATALFAVFLAGCQSGPGRPDPSATVSKAAVEPERRATPSVAPAMTEESPPRAHRYSSVPVDRPYIALTFDDGPSAKLTPQLLDALKERGIPATFYVVGNRVGPNRAILRRMVAEGHEIGNHTWDHSSLLDHSDSSVRDQLMRTNYAIWSAVGEFPTTMRPPYGQTDAALNRRISKELDLAVILWSVDSRDWKNRDPDQVRQQILRDTRAGAVILCHDIHHSTVAAMPATLDALQARGFKFVTVSRLIELGQEGATPTGSGSGSFAE